MPYKDPEKNKEYYRKWQAENKEKYKEYQRKWRAENPEYKRKYYQENKEVVLERARKWQAENKEAVKEYQRKWQKTNPDKMNAIAAKRRASKLQRTPHWLTEDEHWLIKEAYALAKLREKATGIKWHVDHVVPLQGDVVSGLHVPWNLQVIPGSENCGKHNKWSWDGPL